VRVLTSQPASFTCRMEGFAMAETPEYVYVKWRLLRRRGGGNVNPKWFTPDGREEFLANDDVKELAKFSQNVIDKALSAYPKISSALDWARRNARFEKEEPPARKPKARQSPEKKRAASRTVKKTPKQLFSNTDEYYSASYGHRPHSRATPTFGAARCPACGQIEDGCPCSR
jgi:hypothetical protein